MTLLCLNFVCTVTLWITLFFRFKTKLDWTKARGKLNKPDGLFNSNQYRQLILEILICSICPYPFFYMATFNEPSLFGSPDYSEDI